MHSPDPRPAPSWRALAYLLPMSLAAASTLNWFASRRFIAAGDITPFERTGLASELPSLWNHQLSPTGSPSYDIARITDVALIKAVGLFGGSPATAQHLLVATIMAAAAAGGVFFARSIHKSLPTSLTAGVLAAMNPFTLVLLPNVLFVLAIAVLGVLGGQVLRLGRGASFSPVWIALATLPVSYLAVNPPILAVITGWVTVLWLTMGIWGDRSRLWPSARCLGIAGAVAVVLGLWWIVPLALTLANSDSLVASVETDASVWSWSHQQNTIGNVTTLRAHWAWAHVEYYPFAATLDRGIWPFLRWIWPLFSLAGVVVAVPPWRRLAATLAVVSVGSILVAKGLHSPAAWLNLWFYDNVPGFWLLREPMSKVGPVIVLTYVGLTTIALSSMAVRLAGLERPRLVAGLQAATALAVFAAAMAPQPLWSGAVIPGQRATLPSAEVAIPSEWYEIADVINRSDRGGKTVLMPMSDAYQATMSWGYHGVDTVLDQLTARPTLQLLPGGYWSPPTAASELLLTLQASLAAGRADEVRPLMVALGADTMVIRHDLVGDNQGAQLDSEAMEATAAEALGAEPAESNRYASVFVGGPGAMMAVAPMAVTTPTPAARGLAPEQAVTVDVGEPSDGVVWSSNGSADELVWEARSREEMTTSVTQARPEMAVASADANGITLEAASAVLWDGSPMASPVSVRLAADATRVTALRSEGGRAQPFDVAEGDARFYFDASVPVQAVGTGGDVLGSFGGLNDCAASDDRSPSEAGLSATVVGRSVTLAAMAHSACVMAPVDATAGSQLAVSFGYRSGAAPPRVCLWQQGAGRCAAAPDVTPSEELARYYQVVTLDGEGPYSLFLYADGFDNGIETRVEFQDVAVAPIEVLAQADIPAGFSGLLRPTAGPHQLSIGAADSDRALSFGPLMDCGASDARTPDEARLGLEMTDGVIRLQAGAHSACTSAPIPMPAGSPFRLRFDYRVIDGPGARVCVWQSGVDQCANTEPLGPADDWRSFDQIVETDAGATGVSLFLYADGTDTATLSQVEFRQPTVSPDQGLDIAVLPAVSSTPPAMQWHEASPSRYEVNVEGVDGRFELVSSEAVSDGWELRGLPADWSATPIVVNGYANGWSITGVGSAAFEVVYGPDRWAQLAWKISLAALAGCLVWALVAFRRSRPEPPPEPRPPVIDPIGRPVPPPSHRTVSIVSEDAVGTGEPARQQAGPRGAGGRPTIPRPGGKTNRRPVPVAIPRPGGTVGTLDRRPRRRPDPGHRLDPHRRHRRV